MADIILKDASGKNITYPGVETVMLNTSDGATQAYSKGTVAENLDPIELNFADGDQTIYAPDGTLVKSAVIKKPDTLVPENIIKGVEIAGITGTSEGGGISEIDIIPSQTVEVVYVGEEPTDNGTIPVYVQYLYPAEGKKIYAGRTYYIEWNGTTLSQVAEGSSDSIGLYIMMDNKALNLVYLIEDNIFGLLTSEGGTHTVRVYEKSFYGLPCEFKEILRETELTFSIGASDTFPNTPCAVIAGASDLEESKIINNGESGLVVLDGSLYSVYASKRSPRITWANGSTATLAFDNVIGNLSIPTAWANQNMTAVEGDRKITNSGEPFLIAANSTLGFLIAIPEDSTNLTHTLQMFKFVQPET